MSAPYCLRVSTMKLWGPKRTDPFLRSHEQPDFTPGESEAQSECVCRDIRVLGHLMSSCSVEAEVWPFGHREREEGRQWWPVVGEL